MSVRNGSPPLNSGRNASLDDVPHADAAENRVSESVQNSPPADATPDPFDPARLRLTQDFEAGLGVKKALLTVPVRKPAKEHFVRTNPDPEYRIQTGVVELKEDREIYLVDRTLWPDLATESTFGPRLLITTITRQGVLSLWPTRLPGADGRIDDWNRSATEAADMARERWVRVQANMGLGAYDVFEATGNLPDPVWPDLSMGDILRIAFRDKLIHTWDHPVLRRLRGEA